jgi:glycerol-3-phosphate dehydrogenase (NAD(P)+)
MKHISVLGGGAWGTALATVLAHNGHTVRLWCYEAEAADTITTQHINQRYLHDISLSTSITATTDMHQVISGTQWIFQAVPVAHMRTVMQQAKQYCTPNQKWVVLSKGVEQSSLLLPGSIIDDVLGYEAKKVVVSGPSFARELAVRQLTGVTVACADQALAHEVQTLLANNYLYCDMSRDPHGVQACGAFKNVIALGLGMLHGAGCADNTRAFMLTRGLQELALLVQALGGMQETVYGLAGVGDVVLTSLGNLSKNRAVGERLGKGETLQEITTSLHGQLPEGINTVKSVYQLQHNYDLKLPVFSGIYQVIFEGEPVADMMAELMYQND